MRGHNATYVWQLGSQIALRIEDQDFVTAVDRAQHQKEHRSRLTRTRTAPGEEVSTFSIEAHRNVEWKLNALARLFAFFARYLFELLDRCLTFEVLSPAHNFWRLRPVFHDPKECGQRRDAKTG